jgi:hypothetical protein
VHEPVPPINVPGCPPGLAELVMRCLEKHPDLRPASMDEIIVLLKQATGNIAGMSGQFQISQEMRLSTPGSTTTTGRALAMTPSQMLPVGASRAPIMTPSAGFSGAFIQPAQPAAPPPAPPPPATSSHGWLPKLTVIAALGIAGGFLALRFSEESAPAPIPAGVAPTQNTPQAPEPSAEPGPSGGTDQGARAPAEQAPRQQRVIVMITSVPSGASIRVDGRSYGETPANIEWWGEQAKLGREVTFTLQKPGFEKVTLVRSITGEELNVETILPRSNAARRRSNRGSQTPVVVPDTFKDDPY